MDRYRALERELRRIGLTLDHPKVCMPNAILVDHANGFVSKGVYGNFLSHLDILKAAVRDGLNNVLILEDDAIFSHRIKTVPIEPVLETTEWDFCFLGHPLVVRPNPSGFVKSSEVFKWAHCYGVSRRIGPRLVSYLEDVIRRPAGDPLGGKMYIDGALSLFRSKSQDVVSLIAAPALSRQRGSRSSLAESRWYDENRVTSTFVDLARRSRDELWRRGLLKPTGD